MRGPLYLSIKLRINTNQNIAIYTDYSDIGTYLIKNTSIKALIHKGRGP